MNLYIINEKNNAAAYGIGTYIHELTKALRHSPVKVCVIHLTTDKPKVEFLKSDEVCHWYFSTPAPKQKTNISKLKELYYRNIAYLLRLHIEAPKDLVFHLNNNHSCKLADELKRVFDCKIITTVHYLEWSLGLLGNIKCFRKILAGNENGLEDEYVKAVEISYKKEKQYFEMVDHIISISENSFKILMEDYHISQEKITVISNGLSDIISIPDKKKVRQQLYIPDVPIILFVGRLNEIKGLSYLLRAFRIVLKKYRRCQLIIVGNGAFDTYMKECEDIWMHITWTGFINKDKLYDFYSIADIGVIPSLFEPFGLVALEMMMHELPVVVTATSGLNEVVDDTCGFKIPIKELSESTEIDTALLAEKILYMLKNPSQAKKMGKNGRKRYLKEYTSVRFRKNMLEFYKSLYLI